MQTITTTLVPGFQIGSGTSKTDRRFPKGSIWMQMPYFKERGLDLVEYFGGKLFFGTLNLSFAPHTYDILNPEFYMQGVNWTKYFQPENFYLSAASVIYSGTKYPAMLYIPDPLTKPDHFNPPTMVEVLSQTIPDITYGTALNLAYNPVAIHINRHKQGVI